MIIKINPDKEFVKEMREKLRENEGKEMFSQREKPSELFNVAEFVIFVRPTVSD